jgi:hypothetical protein
MSSREQDEYEEYLAQKHAEEKALEEKQWEDMMERTPVFQHTDSCSSHLMVQSACDCGYASRVKDEDLKSPKDFHDSDCATHNMPASPNDKCDCSLTRIALMLRVLFPDEAWDTYVRASHCLVKEFRA